MKKKTEETFEISIEDQIFILDLMDFDFQYSMISSRFLSLIYCYTKIKKINNLNYKSLRRFTPFKYSEAYTIRMS